MFGQLLTTLYIIELVTSGTRACLHFPRRLVDHTICTKAYIRYVSRIPSGHVWKELGMDYRVYFFHFHGVASPKTELRMTFYE